MNSSFITRRRLTNHSKRFISTVKGVFIEKKPLLAYWYQGEEGLNWGDALNPILIRQISGREVISADKIINFRNETVYSVIGSILGKYPEKNLVVWGSGFISSSDRFSREPKKIYAVRGPLTRDLITKQGIYCPEVYGDPALLYPFFYRPNVKKQYKLGIIPHYTDKENYLLNKFKDAPDILIIDILCGVNKVVEDICKCELIASSSLHGIIASDAYGVPSIWIEFSDRVVGNGFKFFDYFESVNRYNEKPLNITEKTTLKDIYNRFHDYKINIDLKKLIDSCPFLEKTQEKLGFEISIDLGREYE
ncbi:polysaccharide pyruvyl transferase family protein [Methanosarcina mazei]|uniref:Polysaccharide pyruvyl transferase domain-containing protein n=1 Tax=Methanosarcina mazei TaxID=2209 RepID=A0A0F8K919_METMZ|nr:polysaccharide pyruvyl transferase family protein [Methanosarcina mazei]KKG75443.1 hypothetical protein DU46_14040 [Methanosarcina mazei]KKG77430.1 hypothetical protein DU61_03820 [Methanosarcina mazei]KKH06684.1 hypothetical protein DU51_02700 [Methanosarcina mazei]KKH07824.1 hypothetical protein DU62_03145 [Methanosarcina mazei]